MCSKPKVGKTNSLPCLLHKAYSEIVLWKGEWFLGRKKIIISIMTVAVLFGMIRLPVSKMMETQILKSDIHYQTHIVNANSLAVENMTVHTEHNWDEGTVTKAATCAGNGTIL